jgi:hypothetical protein
MRKVLDVLRLAYDQDRSQREIAAPATSSSLRRRGRIYVELHVNGRLGLAPLADRERRDLLEVTEDRSGRHATLVTSQVPVDHWHDLIGDATCGDAIMDRLVHHAHRITLTGASLRSDGVRMSSPVSASSAFNAANASNP